MSTAKAERAYIDIISMFPDFFWPESAVLTAYVNGVEVMSETMTITEPDMEDKVFRAYISDYYYDVTLNEGDVLEVELVVTDNLGRTEQLFENIGVKNGELDRVPVAVPPDSGNN